MQIWYFQKKVVSLQPQTCAGDVCTSSAEGSRHIKRRLLALCSDALKSRKFQSSSELSNDRCPTGYRLSLLCLFWYVLCVCTCTRYAYLNLRIAQRMFIFGVGFALSFQDDGQCESLRAWNGNSRTPRFFYMSIYLNNNLHSREFLCNKNYLYANIFYYHLCRVRYI